MGALRIVVTLGLLWLLATPVLAEKLALGDVHGEADVADEAGAVSLLVRTALVGNDRTLLGAPPGFRVADPASLAKVGADHAIAMELSREGTGLRVTIVIVSATPGEDPDVSFVRAGDGDLQGLARGISERITTRLSLEPGKIPAGSLGQLRPFAAAIRRAPDDPDGAATALADVTTRTVLPPAAEALRGLPARATRPALAAIAARAIGDLPKLDELRAGTDATAAAARAFASLHRIEMAAADQALAAAPRPGTGDAGGGLVALARVIVAESRGDDRVLADRIKDALASDQQRATLAFVSTIAATRIPPALHRTFVALAEKAAASSPGVAARIGLAAAEQAVEVTRALGLVSVRELDEQDLERLVPLLARDDGGATILRLRAELAMRRADGSEGIAIAAYLRAADGDPRAHRYHAWSLMAEGRPGEAATAFGKAGANRERARALLVANDLTAALAALEQRAAESAEELVIEARLALRDKQVEVATKKIDLAELAAPANPVVHIAILDLATHKPDAVRVKVSRLVVEKGTSVKPTGLPEPTQLDLAAGSGSAATEGAVELKVIGLDARPLEPLVAALTALEALPSSKLNLVEQRASGSLFSFRVARPEAVRDGLIKLLQVAPYKLRITTIARTLDDGNLDAAKLGSVVTGSDAVLVYRVAPAGGNRADVQLTLHVKGTTTAAQVARTVDMPEAVALNTTKVWVVSVAGVLVVLVLVLWLGRSMGRVKVQIERTNDITDEALCIQITKTPERPAITSEAEFHGATKKAGTITKPRAATLVTNGQSFRIPTGHWFVHLYGVYVRGGQYRKVPDVCTQAIELRRGDAKTLVFDLASKFAELRIVIESEPRKGHTVWANDNLAQKVVTDDQGEAVLMLPPGGHMIHVEAQGHRLKKHIVISAIKIERLPFNVARELRIAGDADLAHGDVTTPSPQHVPHGEIEIDARSAARGTTNDNPAGVKIRSNAKAAVGDDRTLPVAAAGKPGDVLLGRYRIVAELGRGAMGVVRRAWDEKLEREVAIKEMADDLRKNPEAMRLFSQEAKALAQLNHTNIVAMYDQVTDSDRVYMIMEFVDGRPLESLLEEREQIPWREAVGLVDQVLTGLAYAHARKVIHRDIKPANIFIAPDGVVKIGDFGLARVLREVTIRKTEIRGTPLYMAPEQITGTNVDHRADLYAVGCTLFELVTGRPPHIEGDILYAQLHAKPPEASTLVSSIPPALDELILRLIAKQSEDRFASANDARAALRKLEA